MRDTWVGLLSSGEKEGAPSYEESLFPALYRNCFAGRFNANKSSEGD